MARTTPRPPPTAPHTLQPLGRHGPLCGETLWAASPHYRPSTTLDAVVPLPLPIRRGRKRPWPPVHRPSRPEAEGRLAVPTPALGLDGIACVGTRRAAPHRRLPESHPPLCHRGMAVAPRTVTPLLARSAARRTRSRTAPARLQWLPHAPGRGILARDGLPPDVGHAGLWGLRDCLCGAVLRARRGLAAPHPARAVRLRTVRHSVPGPLVGSLSDGHRSRRGAVAAVCPDVPHPLGHFPALREAATPLYAADRQAKHALPKRGRGGRPRERRRAGRRDPDAEGGRGDWAAVRRALTAAGRPPLDAAGRTLHDRLSALTARRERGDNRGPCPRHCGG
jgi:hypothetical protein